MTTHSVESVRVLSFLIKGFSELLNFGKRNVSLFLSHSFRYKWILQRNTIGIAAKWFWWIDNAKTKIIKIRMYIGISNWFYFISHFNYISQKKQKLSVQLYMVRFDLFCFLLLFSFIRNYELWKRISEFGHLYQWSMFSHSNYGFAYKLKEKRIEEMSVFSDLAILINFHTIFFALSSSWSILSPNINVCVMSNRFCQCFFFISFVIYYIATVRFTNGGTIYLECRIDLDRARIITDKNSFPRFN